jgi:hypothetical protein
MSLGCYARGKTFRARTTRVTLYTEIFRTSQETSPGVGRRRQCGYLRRVLLLPPSVLPLFSACCFCFSSIPSDEAPRLDLPSPPRFWRCCSCTSSGFRTKASRVCLRETIGLTWPLANPTGIRLRRGSTSRNSLPDSRRQGDCEWSRSVIVLRQSAFAHSNSRSRPRRAGSSGR